MLYLSEELQQVKRQLEEAIRGGYAEAEDVLAEFEMAHALFHAGKWYLKGNRERGTQCIRASFKKGCSKATIFVAEREGMFGLNKEELVRYLSVADLLGEERAKVLLKAKEIMRRYLSRH